jgi:glycosyltransferase involved in cell wall biosynthesis
MNHGSASLRIAEGFLSVRIMGYVTGLLHESLDISTPSIKAVVPNVADQATSAQDAGIVSPRQRPEAQTALVLLVTNVFWPYVGGVSTYVANLARSLGNGFRAKILHYPSVFIEFEDAHPHSRFRFLLHGLFAAAVLGIFVGCRLRWHRIIFHSHSAAFCMLPGLIAKRFGVARAIHTIHSPIAIPSRFLPWLAPRLDALVFVSPTLQESHRTMKQACNEREVIIAGATDIPPSLSEKTRDEFHRKVARERHIPERSRLIVYAGRIVRDKGVEILAKAMALLPRDDAYAILAGPRGNSEEDLEYFERLTPLAGRAGIEGRFRLLGRVTNEELSDLYSASDVVVIPSVWPEPAPMTAFEAMAHGAVLVASRTGGLPHFVPDGEAGLLVTAGDDQALADALLRVLNDPKLRSQLSRQARLLAEARHSLAAFSQQHEELYRSIL